MLIEQIGATTMCGYSIRLKYPFSTFGESIFIVCQNYILFAMIFYYRKQLNLYRILMIFAGKIMQHTQHTIRFMSDKNNVKKLKTMSLNKKQKKGIILTILWCTEYIPLKILILMKIEHIKF